MSKFSLNLPTSLVENIDYLADEIDTDRTDVITVILEAIMENEDLIDMVFGEALEEAQPTTESANTDENEEEDEEEDSDEDESEE